MPDPAGETPPTTSTTVSTGTTIPANITVGGSAPPPPGETWKDGEPFDAERAQQTIAALREREREGQRAARELEEAKARLKALEDAQKSDDEKRAEELERLRGIDQTYTEHRKRWATEKAVLLAAPQAGIADAALAMAVIDLDKIEVDEQGQPTNVDDVLADLLQRHPALGGETPKPKPPRTDARQGRARDDGPKLTADQMEMAARLKMTPEEYARYLNLDTADKFAAMTAASGKE